MKKFEVKGGCQECPFNVYLGGPGQCYLTKLHISFDGRQNSAWAHCPMKKGPIQISLIPADKK